MGRSRETFGKKNVREKQLKKRKDKEKRKLEKKEQGKQNIDDMIAYVDENGMITSTPQDLKNKMEVDVESIEIATPPKIQEEDVPKQGVVTAFDHSKGYGFIVDSQTKNSVFFHVNDCIDDNIKVGNTVEFDTEKGLKGPKAKNVRIKK
ncbi:MAG: cold shock domain-containing protein [Bacteroidales bacterium]|nr:cold shock domain-containing protein [Bacteroidales bacterium]HPD95837.1 cold shock domain-containing protein [Tenuifilaceae bacterium]HRX31425.1 cold shock domain-containing protein [Tenuifilaceae bacterium]